MVKAKVTLKFTNPNGTHEKKTYTVQMNSTSNSEAYHKAYKKYFEKNKESCENPLSPNYHRPCELDAVRIVEVMTN